MSPVLNPALGFFQLGANAGGESIIAITKALNDVAGSTGVDRFMDSAAGYGHRIVHGHSLEFLPAIFSEFGISGVFDSFIHWCRDLSTVHGVPIPFANSLREMFGLSYKSTIEWMCLNIGDLIGGSLALVHTYNSFGLLSSAVAAKYLSPSVAVSVGTACISKLILGVIAHNPITVFSGLIDLGMMVWGLSPALALGATYFKEPLVSPALSYKFFLGGLVGGVCGALVSKLRKYENETSDIQQNVALGAFIGGITGAVGSWYSSSTLFAAICAAASSSAVVVTKELISQRLRLGGDSIKHENFCNALNTAPQFLLN